MIIGSRRRAVGLALLAALAGGCHGVARETKAPTALCNDCCQQAFDACKIEGRSGSVTTCPSKLEECTSACTAGDPNEICVAQINRELAANAPKAPATAIASAPIKPGECDNKG